MTASRPSDLPELSAWRLLGIAAPLAGAYSTILVVRMGQLLQADIAGALGATPDEASWLLTAYGMAEMLVIPVAVYAAVALSMRRVMMVAAGAFAALGLASAAAGSLPELVVLRALAGLAGGCFSPLSFMMILRTFSDRGRREGLACLAFALIGPIPGALVLAGPLAELADWRALFLLQAVLGGLVFLMAWSGIPATPRVPAPNRDWPGYLAFAVGFPALVLVLTQGERHDWLGHDMIAAAAVVAAAGLAALLLREARAARPLVELRLLLRANFGGVMALNVLYRFGLLVTAFLAAQFLVRLQGWRVEELSGLFAWVAALQLATFPLAYVLASRLDPRLPLVLGLALFAVAAGLAAHPTSGWAADQFRLSLLVVAFAQPLFMVSMIYEGVYGIQPAEGASATTLFNLTRAIGEAAGIAVLTRLVDLRDAGQSTVIAEYLTAPDGVAAAALDRLAAGPLAGAADLAQGSGTALAALASRLRDEALTAAFGEAFLLLVAVMAAAAASAVLLPRVPGVHAGPPRPGPGR